MFSLAGIPPLAGFWGKLHLFLGALAVDGGGQTLGRWFVGLAIIGVVNAAIAAAYYLRIVAVMYFRSGEETEAGPVRSASALVTAFCALLVVGLGVYPGPLVDSSQAAAKSVACPEEPPPPAERLAGLAE